MKKVFVVLAVLGVVVIAGCFKLNAYKSEYVYNFVNACVKNNGPVGYCSCVMDVIQDRVSQEEFVQEDAKFTAEGKFTEKFSKALEEGKVKCMK